MAILLMSLCIWLFERRQKYGARFVTACRTVRMSVYSPPAT